MDLKLSSVARGFVGGILIAGKRHSLTIQVLLPEMRGPIASDIAKVFRVEGLCQ